MPETFQATGMIRNLQVTSSKDESSNVVVSFEIEETDENGNIVNRIPVEYWTENISGNPSEGDKVTVQGNIDDMGILRPENIDILEQQHFSTNDEKIQDHKNDGSNNNYGNFISEKTAPPAIKRSNTRRLILAAIIIIGAIAVVFIYGSDRELIPFNGDSLIPDISGVIRNPGTESPEPEPEPEPESEFNRGVQEQYRNEIDQLRTQFESALSWRLANNFTDQDQYETQFNEFDRLADGVVDQETISEEDMQRIRDAYDRIIMTS